MIARAFSEAYRVLRDSGAMTVMFTHKRADAWNALATRTPQRRFPHRVFVAGVHRVGAFAAPERQECGECHDPPHLHQARKF